MQRTVRAKAKGPFKRKRPAHRPTKFTPELGETICELIACGSLMKDAAREVGIPPETVCRWVAKHEDFREAYATARVLRTEVWAEELVEIADDASHDYRIDQEGNCIFDAENVHRARLRIDTLKWQLVRLDPRLWGNRRTIHVRQDWSQLSQEDRIRKALDILGAEGEIGDPEAPG